MSRIDCMHKRKTTSFSGQRVRLRLWLLPRRVLQPQRPVLPLQAAAVVHRGVSGRGRLPGVHLHRVLPLLSMLSALLRLQEELDGQQGEVAWNIVCDVAYGCLDVKFAFVLYQQYEALNARFTFNQVTITLTKISKLEQKSILIKSN